MAKEIEKDVERQNLLGKIDITQMTTGETLLYVQIHELIILQEKISALSRTMWALHREKVEKPLPNIV